MTTLQGPFTLSLTRHCLVAGVSVTLDLHIMATRQLLLDWRLAAIGVTRFKAHFTTIVTTQEDALA